MLRAFSLIELLVVTGILVVITSMILTNNARFNSSVLLGNAAYDVALSVRQAQVYGLSTQEFQGVFQVGYGVHFQGTSQYFIFADKDNDKRYDINDDEIVRTFTLGRGHRVSRFCGIKSDATMDCSDNAAALGHLDLAFLRPNPDSTITSGGPSLYSIGVITLASGTGETRTVTVQSTGQISVTNP